MRISIVAAAYDRFVDTPEAALARQTGRLITARWARAALPSRAVMGPLADSRPDSVLFPGLTLGASLSACATFCRRRKIPLFATCRGGGPLCFSGARLAAGNDPATTLGGFERLVRNRPDARLYKACTDAPMRQAVRYYFDARLSYPRLGEIYETAFQQACSRPPGA